MTERKTHLDSDGIERIPNEWGFNSFTTAEGAAESAARFGRPGSTWLVWRLPDGTYDFTSQGHEPRPSGELIETIALPGLPVGRWTRW